MNETCVICHRPESTAFACPLCTTQLKTWLWELAGHAADLSTTVITRQTSRRGERVMVTGGSGEQPLIVDLDAAEVAWVLHDTLAAIVRSLCEDRGITYTPERMVPAEFVGPLRLGWRRLTQDYVEPSPALAAWLARSVMSIALSPDALETWGMVEDVHGLVVRTVDIALPRVWLGRCDAVVDGKTCGQDVRATEEEAAVRCSGCMTVRTVGDFRIATLVKARKFVGTAAELAAMLPKFVGKPLTRKRITYYGESGLVKRIDHNGDTVYLLGEVVDAHEGFVDQRFLPKAA